MKYEVGVEYNLQCSHSLNRRSRTYFTLPVIFLKEMPDGTRAKVQVVCKRPYIRYIDKSRLIVAANKGLCPECDGKGYNAGHADGYTHSPDGECTVCPVQICCEVCSGTGEVDLN